MTTQLSRVLNDYLVDNSRVSNFLPFILEAITHNNLLIDQENNDDNDSVVKRKWTVRLNALLASKQASTRWAAICLIKETCRQSESLYASSVQTWTAQLLGVLAKTSETNMMLTTTIETLSLLFEKTIGKSELHAEVTVKSLPRFNQLLLSLSSQTELMSVTLTALSKNTELFPTMSRHIMDQILKIYISCLDNANDVSPSIVGHCLATACRASIKTNIATQWQETLMKLIGSIHQALDRLFETVDEEDNVSDRVTGYPFASTPPDYVETFPILLKRVRYIQDTMTAYLSSNTTVPVGVPIAHLMRLCCRIYNVYQGCVMREYKPKDEYACLMTCLPALHLSTNKLLASLLLSADVGLIQYSKLLARILLRLLSENNNKRAVKISVYNMISLCMQKFGYAFADTILKPVVMSAVNDLKAIEQKRVGVVLRNKKVSGKKRRAEQISSDAFATNDAISYLPCDIQVAALQVLCDTMTLHGSAMDAGLRSTIDTVIVSRILQSTTKHGVNNEETLAVKCYLYKCLTSSIMSPNINQATLLPHAIRLFSAGLNDETHELRIICTQGLAICDLCMHTRMPPIQRVQPVPTTTTTTTSSDTMTTTVVENPTNTIENNDDDTEDDGEEEVVASEQIEEMKTSVSPIMSRPSNVIRAPEDDDDEVMQENQQSDNTILPQQPSIPIVAPSASSSSSTTLTTQSVEQDAKKELLFTATESTFSFTSSTTANDGDNETISTSVTETLTTPLPKPQTNNYRNPQVNQDDSDDDEEFEIPEINMDDD